MNVLSDNCPKVRSFWMLVAALGLAVGTGPASAQNESNTSQGRSGTRPVESVEDRVRIEPYTGPPIFLEEKKVIAPPALVSRDPPFVDKYDNGQVRVERQVAKYSDNHFESDGFYREYYPDGKPFVQGQFVRGRQDGEWTYWYDNGQANRRVNYRNGQLHGKWEIYHPNGNLLAEREYDNGLRDGKWVTYDETGQQALREDSYVKGSSEGVWKLWYPNGNPRREITLKKGVQNGVTTDWTESGEKSREITWVDGKLDGPATIWQADGSKIVRQYKDGLLVSEKVE